MNKINKFIQRLEYLYWLFLLKIRNILKIDYPLFIENVTVIKNNNKKTKKLLLLFKTIPIISPISLKLYSHTNYFEVLEIIKIFNNKNFDVDVLDRDYKDFVPNKKYDVFIGVGAGNSGSQYSKIAKELKSTKNVLMCYGPEPEISKKKVIERYDFFNKRHNTNVPTMRVPDKVNILESVKYSNMILAIGEEGTFSFESYKKYNLPVFSFLPSISSKRIFNKNFLKTRNRNKFLCFAGNGFICKGVDVVIDAFLKMPNLDLTICGPDSEKPFFDVYGKILNKNNNIKYEGFVYQNTIKFNNIIKENAYVILDSSSEGCVTSVMSCMKTGMLPIINYECGISLNDFGYELKHDNNEDIVPEIIKKCNLAALKPKTEYENEVKTMLSNISHISQEGFSKNIENFVTQL